MSTPQGPCLPHCYKCPFATMMLSNVAIVYLIACVSYVLLTRSLGTPFLDSLSCEQLRVKGESSKKRARMFALGIVIGVVVVLCGSPFTS